MNNIDQLLKLMIDAGGSDLHVAAGNRPIYRIHGRLEQTSYPVLGDAAVKELSQQILSQKDINNLLAESNFDFIYHSQALNQRFRGNAFFQKNGLSLVFRWIPATIPSLQQLGFSDAVKKITMFHQGIVLVTGPSGCGKTTTMATLIDLINEERSLHIVTVEEPIEYIHSNKNSLVIQREVGTNVDSFATALKAVLREDPDVIVIGELRDLETISMGITAAETGHLLFGTLNTNNAIQTIDRIIDAYPSDQQPQIRVMFSESLRAIISQQLIPTKDKTGRVCAYELLFANGSVANLIRDSKQYQLTNVMQTGKRMGMQLMDASLGTLVSRKIISMEDGMERALDPIAFAEKYGPQKPVYNGDV